jgi:uncharacterized protein (UPF0276 family)
VTASQSTAPRASGIGLRAPHYGEFLRRRPPVGFVELHSENFFGSGRFGVAREIGGQPRRLLERVRADYALSLHGVGLSLGSAEPPRREHLQQLKYLNERFAPRWLSDHLAWVGIGGIFTNDLLPLPYTEEALDSIAGNVDIAQDFLGRPLLVENPSIYMTFAHSVIPEWQFLNELARRTGCGLLLDVNNVYVSAVNAGFDPQVYLSGIEAAHVGEIHLAGFAQGDGEWLVDTHSRPVDDAVWSLYEYALRHCGDQPTLVEWDADLPELDVLLGEARHADVVRARCVAEDCARVAS